MYKLNVLKSIKLMHDAKTNHGYACDVYENDVFVSNWVKEYQVTRYCKY